MPQMKLTMENLNQLDFGAAEAALVWHLRRCVLDCMDRPLVGKERTVTMQFHVKPIPDAAGREVVCAECAVQIVLTSAVPKHRTRVYTMRAQNDGQLTFASETPENPDQLDLEDARAEQEVEGT